MNKTINKFITELSSDNHTPGGGAVAALNGALAAGLISMVSSISLKNKKFAEYKSELTAISELANIIKIRFIEGIDNDIKIFNGIMKTIKSKSHKNEWYIKSKSHENEWYIKSCEHSFSLLEDCITLQKLCNNLKVNCSASLLIDVTAAELQLRSAFYIICHNGILSSESITEHSGVTYGFDILMNEYEELTNEKD